MKKFTFFLASLFITIGAMAQTVVTAISPYKSYTLECKSGAAHSTARFIGVDNEGNLNGQSAEANAVKIRFEATTTENGYYIKIGDKYLNYSGSTLSTSTESPSIWILGVPTHTADVVTFEAGDDTDLYLNNNGTDGITYLKANSHSGGPLSTNACSLWTLREYDALYRIKDNSREKYLTITDYNQTSDGTHGTVPVLAKEEKNSDQAWYIESTGTENQYYLKSASNYYLVCQDWNVDANNTGTKSVITFNETEGSLYLMNGASYFKVEDVNGTAYPFCDAAANDQNVVTWTLEAVDDAEFSNPITVTYTFTYNGKTFATQETVVQEGSDFPDYTVTLPYSITAAAKPAETVNADNATQEIALTVDESMMPFQTSTIDGSFGDGVKWYNLKMRSKDVTYDASTGYALAENVDRKGAANLFAFTGNPIDGYSIYNYAAGADKVFWRADATDAGRVSFTNIDETNGDTWMLSANGTSGYVFRLKGYDNGYMNDHQPQIAIWNSSWGATDGGSTITFTFVEDPQLTTFYEVTYNYQYNGKTKFSQTIKVEEGASFPAHSYTTPYGVSIAEEVPAETVTETTTKTFTLNIDKEVPFEEGKWYYAQLHMNSTVTSYIQDNNDGFVEWADKDFTAGEIDSHLWKFEGNVWDGIKVINKATGKAITSTSGDATTGDAANATAFFVSNSKATDPSCFCLKYPGINSYLNAQGEQIKSWSANDNGSSFLLTEYKEKDITISEATYATLYLDYAAFIPEGVTASAITGTVTSSNGNYVELGAIEEDDAIPANEGVILNGEAATYTFKLAPAATAFETNLLEGTTTDSYITEEAYVLSVVDGKVGLYLADMNQEGGISFKNNAFKAYLPASATSDNAAITFYSFGFDWGGTTGIENIEDAVEENATKAIYDITGRQIKAITVPGIYIINGKKTFVK